MRLKIEISSAIKCPDIFCHLVGMKKFQEALANPKYLDKFVHSKRHSSIIKNTAVKFYPLNNAKNIRTATQLVANNPRGFVLKPQREGGGNNLFGTSALDFISNQKNLQLLSGYTLMDMINPIESVNYLVSGSTVQRVPCVSELGVYGIWLSFNGTIHLNKHAGILVRSKTPETTEGGVCAGGGYLSSLYVVPTE